MSTYKLYGIGAALLDIELEVSDSFLAEQGIEKGLMTLVEPAQQDKLLNIIGEEGIKTKQTSGGSAANTLYAASCFGAKTYYSCKTSDDASGQFFINDMKAANVECSSNTSGSSLPTGTCLVMVTPDAERTMNTYLAISETLSATELNQEAISASEYFYIEGYLATSETGRAAAIEGKALAEKHGLKTVLTLSDPAMVNFFKPQLTEMLGKGVDLLFCNEEEAIAWSDTDSLQDAAEALKNITKSFAITLGSRGALVFDGKQTFNIAAKTIKAIDSNGAGDIFAGAFLYGISSGWDFEKSGKLASAAAANVVSQYGPRLKPEKHQSLLETIN